MTIELENRAYRDRSVSAHSPINQEKHSLDAVLPTKAMQTACSYLSLPVYATRPEMHLAGKVELARAHRAMLSIPEVTDRMQHC